MYKLRDYQARARDDFWNYFQHNNGNPLMILPTGSGKSLVLAACIKKSIDEYPQTRVLVLSHVREIIQQDAEKLDAYLPFGYVGVYSAGLGRKELGYRVTVASIQSIVNATDAEMGKFGLVFIDEAHLVPDDGEGRYRTLISRIKNINPHVNIVGLTATAFRMKSGLLYQGENAIFTDVATKVGIKELIEKGYLSPVRSKSGATEVDLSTLKIRGGDYIPSEAEMLMMSDQVIKGALDECEKYAADRKSWLVFCAGVDHALKVTEELNARGITASAIFGSTPSENRSMIIKRFREGKIRALVNVMVLTIGFDAPATDCLVMLRPTKSPGLYVQKIGRGMRIAPGKEDCLVLDFAGNILEHGPVDLVTVAPKKAPDGSLEDGPAEPPMKICPVCRELIVANLSVCSACGFRFPKVENPPHEEKATDAPIISGDVSPARWIDVDAVAYTKHYKKDSHPSLQVTYMYDSIANPLDAKTIREWVCLEHRGIPLANARSWWYKMAMNAAPENVDQAIARKNELAPVKRIKIQRSAHNRKFFDVIDYELGSNK